MMTEDRVLLPGDEVCLVTGGSGFIGSHLVRELVSQGKKVVVYDFTPDAGYIADCLDNVTFIYGDVADMAHLSGVVGDHGVGLIFHLAYMLVPDTGNRLGKAIQVNCAGFQNVLEAARVHKVRRVVWPSSAAVFGYAENYPEGPINEDVHVMPTTLYAACKQFNEYVAKYYRQARGLDNVGFRKPVVYGVGKSRRRDLSISHLLIENAILGRPVEMPPMDFHANYLYVGDAVRAYLLAAQAPPTEHVVFNIGGEVQSCSGVVQILRELFPDLVVDQQVAFEADNPIDAWNQDPARARVELGYEPAYRIKAGVQDFVETLQALGHLYTASGTEFKVTAR
jgi:nucleoside-diphosphate-sugar epimerase